MWQSKRLSWSGPRFGTARAGRGWWTRFEPGNGLPAKWQNRPGWRQSDLAVQSKSGRWVWHGKPLRTRKRSGNKLLWNITTAVETTSLNDCFADIYLFGGLKIICFLALAIAPHPGVHFGVHHLDRRHGLEQPEEIIVEQLAQGQLYKRRQEKQSSTMAPLMSQLEVVFFDYLWRPLWILEWCPANYRETDPRSQKMLMKKEEEGHKEDKEGKLGARRHGPRPRHRQWEESCSLKARPRKRKSAKVLVLKSHTTWCCLIEALINKIFHYPSKFMLREK